MNKTLDDIQAEQRRQAIQVAVRSHAVSPGYRENARKALPQRRSYYDKNESLAWTVMAIPVVVAIIAVYGYIEAIITWIEGYFQIGGGA